SVAPAGPASVRLGLDAVTGIVTDLSGTLSVPARVLVSTGARLDVTPEVRLAPRGGQPVPGGGGADRWAGAGGRAGGGGAGGASRSGTTTNTRCPAGRCS